MHTGNHKRPGQLFTIIFNTLAYRKPSLLRTLLFTWLTHWLPERIDSHDGGSCTLNPSLAWYHDPPGHNFTCLTRCFVWSHNLPGHKCICLTRCSVERTKKKTKLTCDYQLLTWDRVLLWPKNYDHWRETESYYDEKTMTTDVR